ncbi:class A beta-lactamase-related serine hydrolase [Maribacter sp. MJ134]|uniref:serine hydrolase domain-containing protein n=1 Tax=Maribacter sp. MJ134 TaxID=2496865 RepID=UPI000F83D0E9|nr:serine hydrolase domain-containing protein [Maribacter sp. MJ134]AZQ59336.1 class A beta-lactamase-related serine hydrolase [Maribacter sp. MJ134]
MKRFLKYTGLAIVLMVVHTLVVFLGTDNGWWYTPFTKERVPETFIASVQKELHNEFVGNMALGVFKNGQLEAESFHSNDKLVDRNTVFQVASLSKFVSAIGVMKLVQDGKLDLDVPIDQYLTRWHLPKSGFDNSKVTVRRLLSHTAGLTDGLGYAGFESLKDLQSLESSLTKATDADPGSDVRTVVGIEPGIEWRYSGGGFTLLQLIVEEVSGQSFDVYMKTEIFEQLQMTSSFYEWDERFRECVADFYNSDGSKARHRYYTAQAASALYTTLADLEKLFYSLKEDERKQKPLSVQFQKMMWQAQAETLGTPIYGLGTFLYAELENNSFIIGHDGKNNPPLNTAFRYNPLTKDGIILLTTGSTDFATRIASDWVYIHTGKVDALLFKRQLGKMIQTIIIGLVVILVLVISIAFIRKKLKNNDIVSTHQA